MTSDERSRRGLPARILRITGLAAALSLLALPSHAGAADGTSLYRQAAGNLTRLSTFVEHVSFVEQSSALRYRNDVVKAFDRRHTRVEGQQTLVESQKAPDGKWHTVKYINAVVMLNHKTYVRTSRSKGWVAHAGYGYTDPVTKGRWVLAAPDYRISGLTFTIASRSKGTIHLVGHGMKVPESVTVDITSGSNPILMRIMTTGTTTNQRAGRATFAQVTSESGFNKPLNITAPK